MITSMLLAVCALGSSGTDVVKLSDGKSVEGRVIFEGKQDVVVQVGSQDRRIPLAQVQEIDSQERRLARILERAAASSLAEKDKLVSLAEECDKALLPAEARNFRLRILLADPGD